MFFKIVSVLFVVAGLGLLGTSVYYAFEDVQSGTTNVVQENRWTCEPNSSQTGTDCETIVENSSGALDLNDFAASVTLGLLGLGLTVSAVVVNQLGVKNAAPKPVPVGYGPTPGYAMPQG